uniref:Uncharacterized protein n=1 Tax=Arundo donax TaxID=35708 RepID=A0A0A8XVR2_ARUDO
MEGKSHMLVEVKPLILLKS